MGNKLQNHNNSQYKLLGSLIETCCKRFGSRPAMSMAMQQSITYDVLLDRIVKLAIYLKKLGIHKGDRVAILAENSPNWGISYLAIVRLGAVAVPILPDFTGPDVRNILIETNTLILFATARQLEKIYELNSHHNLLRIITLDDSREDNSLLHIEPFSFVLQQAEALGNVEPAPLELHEEEIASIIYTSGTTGHSKAVMLSHRNLIANVEATDKIIDIQQGATFLSILPLSHTYEFTIGFLLPLINGCRIVYLGKPPTPTLLEKVCQHEKPTAICAVPMVMEKIYKKRVAVFIDQHLVAKLAISIPIIKKLLYRQIGKRLLKFFGGRLRVMAIGGAPLLQEVENFLAAADFPYIIGYGLTETAPLLAAGPFGDKTIKLHSTGKPVPGVAIRIANPDSKTGIGEIQARGPNIMKGYFNNPEQTAATIDKEGWLSTGDLGCFDPNGNLYITGRLKSTIVLAHGENIYPEIIEDLINSSYHVAEALVTAREGRLVAHIYLDPDRLSQEINKKSPAEKTRHIEKTLKTIQNNVNRQLPPYSQINLVIERREPFIKTATQKIKRHLYTM